MPQTECFVMLMCNKWLWINLKELSLEYNIILLLLVPSPVLSRKMNKSKQLQDFDPIEVDNQDMEGRCNSQLL